MIPGRSATPPAPPSWGPPVLELVTPHRQLQSTQRAVQVRSELTAGRVGRCRQRPHNQRATGRQSSETVGHEMSQPAAHPVADHRVPDRLTHDEAHPGGRLTGPGGRRHLRRLGAQGMQDQPGPPSSTSPADHRPELPATGESGGRGEHGAALPQADSSARPLRRRADRMARPARVRIRSRNPWVLLRRRLLGWKVRLPLLTVDLQASSLPLLELQVCVPSPGCLDTASRVHAKGTRRERGTASRVRTERRPHQIGGSGPGRSARHHAARDTCPDRTLVAGRHAC